MRTLFMVAERSLLMELCVCVFVRVRKSVCIVGACCVSREKFINGGGGVYACL